jgi:hypothetical protein
MKKLLAFALVGICFCSTSIAQKDLGELSGNISSYFQYLLNDSTIGATQPTEKGLINSFANVNYRIKGFNAGLRVESYLPRIQGYPDRFDGTGIGYRYIGYSNDFVDVTLGNFYDQFGSGMLFRAWESNTIGYDNEMDGIRLAVHPYKGITIKGVYGRQRFAFQNGKVVKSDGITRGFDADFNFKTIFPKLEKSKFSFSMGGSFVSKFQKANDPVLNLPQNVGAYGGRMRFGYAGFFAEGEYVMKEADPSSDNKYIYNKGSGLLINMGYSRKGLGILLQAKSVDNMSYRSDRTKDLQDLYINYLPSLTKTHTYNLVATLYPYTTQPLGEVAFQGDVIYTIPRGTKIGGKYGTNIALNFSTAYQPVHHTSGILPNDSSRVTYKAVPFDKSNLKFWQDFNVTITRKFNKLFKMKLSYFNIQLNNNIVEVSTQAHGIINSHIVVADLLFQINNKHSIRTELQGLFTKDDRGGWTTFVIEYTVSPHWYVSIMDQYNYGNPIKADRTNYLYGSVGYIRGSSRISVSYGRQRAGLFCVGGICRYVPASNGLTISFTQSF